MILKYFRKENNMNNKDARDLDFYSMKYWKFNWYEFSLVGALIMSVPGFIVTQFFNLDKRVRLWTSFLLGAFMLQVYLIKGRAQQITLSEKLIYQTKKKRIDLEYENIALIYKYNLFTKSKGCMIIRADGKDKIKISGAFQNCWYIWNEIIDRVTVSNPNAEIDTKFYDEISYLRAKYPGSCPLSDFEMEAKMKKEEEEKERSRKIFQDTEGSSD
jgi:hypothetical protein